MAQNKRSKREARVRTQMLRHGTPKQGHGHAAKQAARRFKHKGARRARRGTGRSKNYQV